jgi:hypothetical protein
MIKNRPARSTEDSDRIWLVRLVKEYDSVVYSYNLKRLRPANIRLSEGSSTLGSWARDSRTIAISKFVLRDAPWEIVAQILRHEMAHQIADELLGGDPGHGPNFQKGCQMIWVEPWARSPKIESLYEPDASDPEQSIWSKLISGNHESEFQRHKDRLRKLFALSESSNPNEASLALSKAMKLQQDLLISPDTSDSDFETRVIRTKKKRLERHIVEIGAILSRFYKVRIIYCSEFDTKDLCAYKTIEILGERHDAELAEHIYHFLLSSIQSQYLAEQSKSRFKVDRKSFFDGVLSGFSAKLRVEEVRGKNHPQQHALMTKKDTLLDQYFSKRHPKIVNRTSSRSAYDQSSYERGKLKGENLEIRLPIRNKPILSIE